MDRCENHSHSLATDARRKYELFLTPDDSLFHQVMIKHRLMFRHQANVASKQMAPLIAP
jgi:hypothetical protein